MDVATTMTDPEPKLARDIRRRSFILQREEHSVSDEMTKESGNG
jgi:hypothetical protein